MSLLEEGKANTHLTHLEELVLTQGPKGFEMAKQFLLQLLETLKGNSKSSVQTSVKWDGAPAIFAGINPENGKFFVGTKSIFNKVPKINYTPQDIITNHGHAPGLVDKLTKALKYLPSLGIKNILQGDFMFDDGMLDVAEIDGEPHYRFKPNTIVYAVPVNSDLGKEIGKSKFGIVFHTTYDSLDGGASFGADVSGLKRVPGIWFDDAFFTDDTGTVTLTSEEESRVLELVTKADAVNKEIDYSDLPFDLLNIYINSEIKSGEFLQSPEKSFEGFMGWYAGKLEVKIDKLKSAKGKDRARARGRDQLELFKSKKDSVLRLFEVSRLLFEAKNIFIAKYNNAVYNTKHFIDDGSGDLVASNPEGYVAVDHEGNGVKFVDRLEFSRANFMIDKGDKFTQNESLTVYWGNDGVSTTHTLLEWSDSLPSTTKTNKTLFNMLQAGVPITSVGLEADTVKESLASAVNWRIEEGLWDSAKAAGKKAAFIAKNLPGAASKVMSNIGQLKSLMKEEEAQTIAAVAGGFKPPHRGHMEMIAHYANMADKVKLFIGKSARPIKGDPGKRSITAEQSAAIWDQYLSDAGLSDRVDIEVISGSPMKASYSVLEDALPGQTILMGCGQKDTYFTPESLAKYAPEGVEAKAAPCPSILDPNTKRPYSATAVRDTIKNNDLESFAKFLPKESLKRAREIFALLGGSLQEMSSAGGAAPAVSGASSRVPEVVGSEEEEEHKNDFLSEEELVTEVMDYLLGISVG